MLMGYLSCFLAPIIPTLAATNAELTFDDSKLNYRESNVENMQFSHAESSFYFFDNQYDIEQFAQIDTDFSNCIPTEQIVAFKNYDFVFESKYYSFSLFSRPPPFSFS